MILTNKLYDILKWTTLIFLPAFSVLYLAMANIWMLPYGTEIVATIAAIDLFLAAVLGISTNTFKVNHPMYRLNLVKLAGDVSNSWILSTNTYEVLTWVAQILLPSLATFYGAMAAIWNFPFPDQVIGTIIAIDALLGMMLGFSTAQFHKRVAFGCVEEPEARIEG